MTPHSANSFPSVPFEQLTALMIFVDTGSVASAAKILGISQPAVSNLLSRLDAKFAQSLFTVNGGRKVLTDHGKVLYESLTRPMRDVSSAFDRYQRLYAAPGERRIRIAARREILSRVLARLPFTGRLDLKIMSSDEILEALRLRRCDLAIVQRPVADAAFAVREWYESQIVMVIPKALLGQRQEKGFLTAAFFQATPFVAYRDDHPFLADLTAVIGESLVPQKVVRSCEDWEFVSQIVSRGFGFTVMPKEFAKKTRNCLIVPLSPHYLPPVIFKILCLRELLAVPGISELIDELSGMTKG